MQCVTQETPPAKARPTWRYDDGGRKAAGFRLARSRRAAAQLAREGQKVVFGDCVIRSIAIAAQLPYEQVRQELWDYSAVPSDPVIHGVWRDTYERWLLERGWTWTPTMQIGSGCKVHLRADELPPGRLIVQVTHHITAVIDGVIHDIHDPSRGGTRCVYGFYRRSDS